MAAFFKTPAPPGRDRARAGLIRVWRIGADGRLECHWVAETAQIVPFKARAKAGAIPAGAQRTRAIA